MSNRKRNSSVTLLLLNTEDVPSMVLFVEDSYDLALHNNVMEISFCYIKIYPFLILGSTSNDESMRFNL